jgi:hypothetical protein
MTVTPTIASSSDVVGDSSTGTYVTVTFTTKGKLPIDGYIKMVFPYWASTTVMI